MKNNIIRINVNQTKFIIIVLSLFCLYSCKNNNEIQELTKQLDYVINNKQIFVQEKENRINRLKNQLEITGLLPEQEYDINTKLYDEYRKYKLDSAVYYIEQNLQIADKFESTDKKYDALIKLARIYSFSEMYIESQAILESIEPSHLSKKLRGQYYEAYIQFYDHYGTVNYRNKNEGIIENLQDSLLSIINPNTITYKSFQVKQLSGTGDPQKLDQAEKILLDLFKNVEKGSSGYASIANQLGNLYKLRNQPEFVKKYYTIAAITDVKCVVKENAAIQNLALIYLDEGDEKRAFNYTQSAIEDAIFGGAQFRTSQISKFYSIINTSYLHKEAVSKKKLRNLLILTSLLSFIMVFLVIRTFRQKRKLSIIKEEQSEMNCRLTELNNEMTEKNALLSESNLIKEQYIAQFFDLCSDYIDKLEEYRKSLSKLAFNRQIDELVKRLKTSEFVETEVEELYIHFDNVFLGLYPTFVSDFNSLLDEDEQIIPKAGSLLNRELRIYALVRLGISDNIKIASFLRCSINTIYNYRTKARNNAVATLATSSKISQ